MQITTNFTKNKMLNSKMHSSQMDKIMDLQLQLKEAKAYIEHLTGINRGLIQQLSIYERRCQEMKILEEELQFRKQQEKQMQEHLDNYHDINEKLRQQVVFLEAKLKSQSKIQTQHCYEVQKSQSGSENNRKLRQLTLFDENVSTRRSLGGNQKQNHPITPKARVNLSINAYMENEIGSVKHLNGRKIFL